MKLTHVTERIEACRLTGATLNGIALEELLQAWEARQRSGEEKAG